MELSNFQRKAVILIFISILIGAILLARKEPLRTHEVTQPSKPPTQVNPIPTKIDINTADISLIMQLPGIGPNLAKGIIDHRPYSNLEDLLKVPGIGEKRLARIKEMIDLPEGIRDTASGAPPQSAATGQGTQMPATKIDLNKATTEQLLAIPGIGPTLAQAIIDYRERNSRFNSLEELIYVPRIGQKTYKKLEEYLYVEICEVRPREPRIYDPRIDPKVKCPYCGKQLWEKGKRKTAYVRCPHCLRLLNE